MISAEVESRQTDASARVSLWDECLSNSIDKVNARYGLNISYRFRFLDDGKPGNETEVNGNNEESEAIKQWVIQSQR